SPIPLKRKAFQVMKRLTLLYTYGVDGSPYAAASGYVRGALDAPAPKSVTVRLPRAGETLDADVCVIGSGAGGGVVAAELSRAGKRVVVLERATPRFEDEFDGRELAGYAALFVDRGVATTTDRAIALLAGSALGGGTIVNWNTSLRIPAAVQEEWRAAGFDDLAPHYDAVAARIDVDTDESERNGANAGRRRGATSICIRSRSPAVAMTRTSAASGRACRSPCSSTSSRIAGTATASGWKCRRAIPASSRRRSRGGEPIRIGNVRATRGTSRHSSGSCAIVRRGGGVSTVAG